MERPERLLDIVAMLLTSREPVPFSRIRDEFPDYQSAHLPSAERKWERDKAQLIAMGIPLRFTPADGDIEGGYQVHRAEYELRAGPVPPELLARVAVLSAAKTAAQASGWRELTEAVQKLGGGPPLRFGEAPQPGPRITRLLVLVPFLAARPGVTIDAIAEAFGVARDVILGDLEAIPLVGRPPFGPDDYLEVQVDGDRVTLSRSGPFTRPPAPSKAEMRALDEAGRLLDPAPGLEQVAAAAVAVVERRAVMVRGRRVMPRSVALRRGRWVLTDSARRRYPVEQVAA